MICPKCNSKFYTWRVIYLTRWNSIKCPNCKTRLKRSRAILNEIIQGLLIILSYSFFALIFGLWFQPLFEFSYPKFFLAFLIWTPIFVITEQFTLKLEIKE